MRSPTHAFTAVLAVSVLAMLASVLPPFSDWISIAANNMWPYPGPDLSFDYFMGGVLGLLCGVFLLTGPIPAQDRGPLLICWAFKIAAGLFLVPVYEFAYGLDIDGYFCFNEMPQFDSSDFQRAGTWNIRILAWAMFKVIGPTYHGGKILFSFLGFIGIYLTYRGAVFFLRQERPLLLFLTALAPTSLFWATSLGKDPIALLGAGVYSYGVFHWLRDYRLRHLIAISSGILIASHIRPYFLPIMGVPIVLAYLIQSQRLITRILLLPVVLLGLVQTLNSFKVSMNIETFDAFVQYQSGVASAWTGGSSFSLPVIDTPLKLALVSPLAIFTALFRPTILEAHNLFSLGAALDNTLLLVIFFYAVARSRLRDMMQPEVLWMGSYVSLWAVMYGIGTGNLGAISRFKIQALPLFITLLLYMARKRTPAPQQK